MSKHYLHRANVLEEGSAAHSILGEGIDLAVEGLAGFGFGYLTGRFREKTLIAGRVPLDFGAGLGMSALGLVLGAFGIDEGAALARDVGHAGFVSWAHTHGVGAGTKASGVKRVLVQEKDLPKLRAAVPSSVVLGSTGQAPAGKFMAPERLKHLSQE